MSCCVNKTLKEILTIQKEKILMIDEINKRSYTYETLFKKGYAIKKNLEMLGVKKGEKIIVILENGMEIVYLYFAGLLGDFILVPIEPHKGEEEINNVLNELLPSYIITHKEYKIKKHISLDLCKILHDQSTSFNEVIECIEKKDFEKPYLITYTSGTTGVPKGVIHSFKNLFTSLAALATRIGLNEKTVLYHQLPMTYMAGILEGIALPLACKGTVVIGKRFDSLTATSFWDKVAYYGVNTIWLNPTMIALILKLDRSYEGVEYLKNHLTTIISISAKLQPHIRENFEKQYNVRVFETYALSELLFVSANSQETLNLIGCAGPLLQETRVQVNNEDQELEVCVPWRFLGYINEETSSYFKGCYYKTGDVGYIENNLLYITDRKKELIIRGGFNLSANKIKQLLINEGIKEAEVVGVSDDILGEKVVCFYTQTIKPSRYKLNQVLINTVGREYQIDQLVYIDKIPHNINGKVDKKILIEIAKRENRG